MIRSLFLGVARTSLAAAALLVPALGVAQDTAAVSLDTVAQATREAYQTMDGQEVRIEGTIGVLVADLLYFADESGRYLVKLDAGRDVRRRIEGCELSMFDPTNSKCKVSGMAEISIDTDDDNIGDGVEISLVLYEVDSLETGEE